MTKQLQERKEALQSVRKSLNGKASLRSEEGKQYIRCLVMLVGTEMQLKELQDMKKDACQRPQ
ncbi:hypothetical protein [Paenibacillus sp. Cedars]|uniref:hypothetical protein n=1 Tax=Paenibacillus sp. Cedars TaxID=1980674 RepID=UPI0011635A9A|nr:hypothetical protein [Paenibacillus sp. Cedars]AWP26350.1 hypothetical protein B9D94_06865 [Paenibacillus sp. Cedars]